MLNSLITSKTRLRLLIKFFISQANKAHLNGLANEFGESTNSIRKELNNLFDAGYLLKSKSNNKIEYNVNPKHPLYKTMRKVVMKHLGLEDIVETVLEKMGAIEKIILIGDYAKGIDSGNIEVILTGKDLDMEYISNIENKIEKLINRKVTFYLSSKFLSDQQNIILYTNEV
ncbi:MAG: ArsR family transcriptional regulator [Flammeovirgaceae bacterium]